MLLYFVRPTGTTEIDSTMGRRVDRSEMLRSRCGPSLMVGQSTSCVWQKRRMLPRRLICSMISPARGPSTILRRPWLWYKAFWQTLDKAEDTFIRTLPDKGCSLFTEEHSQIFIDILGDTHFILLLLPLETKRQFFIGNVKTIIYEVTNEVTVDCAQKITRL